MNQDISLTYPLSWLKNKYSTTIDCLFVRIFLSFVLCLLVIITFTLIVPNLDQRRIKAVPTNALPKLIEMSQQAFMRRGNKHFSMFNREYMNLNQKNTLNSEDDLDKKGRNRNKNWANRDQISFLFFDSQLYEQQLEDAKAKPDIANFISKTITSDVVMQQKMGERLIIGPITVPTAPNLKIYIGQFAAAQHYWMTRLFDDPIVLLFIMMICSLPFVALLSWSLSRPVRALRNAADSVAAGNWDNLPAITGPVEFRAVGLSFNRMIEIIKSDQAEKNQLFANLSHELRTPLARIALTNALIRRKHPEMNTEILRIEHNLQALETRIQSMLALSRTQMLEKESLEITTLEDILQPIIDEMQFESSEKNIQFNAPTIPDISLNSNPQLLQSAIENILRNALRFAKTQVSMQLIVLKQEIKILVFDDGTGIEPTELETIFKPFYRNLNQENDHQGAGLGLAIAKLAVEIHQGTIIAENQETGGLLITVTLPTHALNAV